MRRRIEIGLPLWLDDVLDDTARLPTTQDRMRLAIELARTNVDQKTGGPFGAVVVEADSGIVLGAGVNLVLASANCTAHAEMVAIELAESTRGSFDLGSRAAAAVELVTTVEPCAMCLGAVVWSGASRLVCGAPSGAAAEIGFDEGPRPADWVDQMERRGIEVVRGVMADSAQQVLTDYVDGGGLVYNASR